MPKDINVRKELSGSVDGGDRIVLSRLTKTSCILSRRTLPISLASPKLLKEVLVTVILILSVAQVVSRTPTAGASPPVLSGTEVPVVVSPGDQLDPSISGPFVTYTDRSSGDSDVWYYDATSASVHPVVVAPGNQQLSDISGTDIVYTDFTSTNGDIFLYDISTGTTTRITSDPSSQSNPTVSSRLIAWEDLRGADRDIWIHDLVLGGDRAIIEPGVQNSPAASGSRVVYVDGAGAGAIKIFDIDTSVTMTVFSGPAINPEIDDVHVTFADLSGVDADVAVYDVSGSPLARLVLPGDQVNPQISGEWVSFEDLSTGTSHLGLWHWTTGDVYYPITMGSQQILNDISGNRIVYTDTRNGNLDIYAFDFTLTGIASSTTSVFCNPARVAVNQVTLCTATVKDTSPTPVSPTGAVSFSSNSSGTFIPSLCSLVSYNASMSSCSVAYDPLPGSEGTHIVTGTYGGDSNHSGSSGSFGLTVTKRSTSTSISCSLVRTRPKVYSCAATVTDTSPDKPLTPTGKVLWASSGKGVFSSTSCMLSGSGSTASCTVFYAPSPIPGGQTITATYPGDTDHFGSSGKTTVIS